MLIDIDEWKAVQSTKDSILRALDIMKLNSGMINVRELEDWIFMVSGEYFSINIRMQAIEDLLTAGDIKATIINTETVIITL